MNEFEEPLPPLRIHHLMFMTVVAAVVLTVIRLLVPIDQLAEGNRAGLLLPLLEIVLYSIGFCVFLFAAYWRYRGLTAFAQPGQWLLLIYPMTIAYMIPVLGMTFLASTIGTSLGVVGYVVLVSLPVVVVPLAFDGYALWRIADTLWWRMFFALKLAGGFFQLVLLLNNFVPVLQVLPPIFTGASSPVTVTVVDAIIPGTVVLAAIITAMFSDARAHPRHWSAWFGASLVAVMQFVSVVQAVFFLADA